MSIALKALQIALNASDSNARLSSFPTPLQFVAHYPPCPPTCSMPFMAHQVQNQTREVEKPKATLRAAVAIRPPASSMVGEVRDPSTPDTNLLRCREGCRAERWN